MILLCCIFTQCKSPSEKIKEAFDTVDKSLEKSHKIVSYSIDEDYLYITSNRKSNPVLALKADTVYLINAQTIAFIDSLKKVLQLMDTSGTDIEVSAKLLIKTNAGNALENKLSGVYRSSISYFTDELKKQQIDSVLYSIKEISSDKLWRKKYFQGSPTVASLTMLSSFQNNCINSTAIILDDIRRQLGK
jgi:glucosamine 6-phosphate synthetase-like amidotransferase/phosphosugar isomerase protein